MFALQLLLSPYGRMKRLNYILLSGLFGAMNFGLLVLMGLQSGAGIFELLGAGPMYLVKTSPFLAAVSFLGLWVHTCFVFKRSRDFSGTTTTGWLYVGFWIAPFVAPNLLGANQAAMAGGAMQFIFAVPAALVGMVLFFANSREANVEDSDDFGTEWEMEPATAGLGNLDEHTDLVARAAALRPVDAPPPLSPQLQPSSAVSLPNRGAVSTGFGRRRTSAANSAR